MSNYKYNFYVIPSICYNGFIELDSYNNELLLIYSTVISPNFEIIRRLVDYMTLYFLVISSMNYKSVKDFIDDTNYIISIQ